MVFLPRCEMCFILSKFALTKQDLLAMSVILKFLHMPFLQMELDCDVMMLTGKINLPRQNASANSFLQKHLSACTLAETF